MNETEKELIGTARYHLIKGNIKEACTHYFKVGEEHPENAEAEFFSAYLGYQSLIECDDGASAANAFRAMTSCLEKVVKCVKESDSDDENEKVLVLAAIVEVYTPITRFLFKKHTTSNTIEGGVLGLYALGSAIKNEFGSDPTAVKLSIEPWKEAIALQRTFFAYKYNGVKPEDYAPEIQKVDPTYTMPQKAGCISKG